MDDVAVAASDHPVGVSITDDPHRGRWSVFFRLILALPHIVVLGAFATIAVLLAPILWIVTLIRAQPPHGLAEYYGRLIAYTAHVQAYLNLATGPFPPFLGGRGSYALDVELPLPERQNRWSIAFRGLLAVPALAVSGALGGGFGGAVGGYGSIQLGVLTTVGFLAWFACLVRGRMPQGFRDLLVYSLGYGAQVYAYLFFLTGRYPNADPVLAPPAATLEHPVRMNSEDDDLRRSRLTVFFRLLLALPHILWVTLWSILGLLVAIAAWLTALVLGRVPGPLHRFLAALMRYSLHVNAFVYLAANPFPGFTGAPGRYPIDVEIDPPERQSRWTVLFRGLLAFPALLVASALSGAQSVAALLGWFAALFTGRMPRGLRELIAYSLRYTIQTSAYLFLLTPRYPYSGPARFTRPAPTPAPLAAPEALG